MDNRVGQSPAIVCSRNRRLVRPLSSTSVVAAVAMHVHSRTTCQPEDLSMPTNSVQERAIRPNNKAQVARYNRDAFSPLPSSPFSFTQLVFTFFSCCSQRSCAHAKKGCNTQRQQTYKFAYLFKFYELHRLHKCLSSIKRWQHISTLNYRTYLTFVFACKRRT